MPLDMLLLFVAGILGGIVNAIAGGGSFITFPALLFVGIPPVAANATNTYASFAGYVSGAVAFREELSQIRPQLLKLTLISLGGGLAGAWLLLQTDEDLFQRAIPWLLLIATFLFIFGGRINQLLSRFSHFKSTFSVGLLSVLLLLVCIYGGFFNAGLGIIILSYLVLQGYQNIHLMNGLKLLISSAVSVTAIGLFIANGAIVWFEGSVLLLGTLIGGYIAAHTSRNIPQHAVRKTVIFASVLITLHFFQQTYSLIPFS